ncbi:MAG: LXG domain-containing protein [Thermoanaerobacterium thermosaccharolyticum]
MKKYKVTYYLSNKEWTETMSEGQLKNFEKRLENGAEEQIISVNEIQELPSDLIQAFRDFKKAAYKLDEMLEKYDIDLYATKYPFVKSFSDVADDINDWYEAVVNQETATSEVFKELQGEILNACPGYQAVIKLDNNKVLTTSPVRYIYSIYDSGQATILYTKNSVYKIKKGGGNRDTDKQI